MTNEVNAVSVPQGIAEHIKGLIRRGELGPGDRLPPERELAESLGVARVSLREALKFLQEAGYITSRRGKTGVTFVTALSQPLAEWRRDILQQEDELDDVTAMRVALESHAAALAAERRTQDDLAVMEAAIRQQAVATNRSEFRLADTTFHAAVGRAARSRRLEHAMRQARSEFFTPADLVDHPDPVEEDNQQHQAIFDAIKDGDSARANAVMRSHIEHTRAELRRLLGA
jgi:DNA-binding FadR family transcriptional regulator